MHPAGFHCPQNRLYLLVSDMLVPAILGSDPRVGVQEDNNRFAVLLDLAGDLTEVDVSEILAGAEFAAPLKRIFVDVDLQFQSCCGCIP